MIRSDGISEHQELEWSIENSMKRILPREYRAHGKSGGHTGKGTPPSLIAQQI